MTLLPGGSLGSQRLMTRLDGDRFKVGYYLDLLREAGVKGVA